MMLVVILSTTLLGALKVCLKYRLSVCAIRGVAPDTRAEVIRAVGDAWRVTAPNRRG